MRLDPGRTTYGPPGGMPDAETLDYWSKLLTVVVLGAAAVWAGGLIVQGRFSAAMRALTGRRP